MDISSDRYAEREGKLYVLPADRGTDISKGAESYEVVRVSGEADKVYGNSGNIRGPYAEKRNRIQAIRLLPGVFGRPMEI